MIDQDYHFELLPEIDSSDGAPFGIGLSIGLEDGGFTPGSTDWAVQDSENSQNGTTAFGRDRLLGPVYAWELHANMDDDSEALAALRSFRKAWHWLHGRDTPGKVTALRFQLDGEQRRIYGRPRRFEAPPDNRILGGMIPISVDFKCVDGFVYDDVMESVSMQLGQTLEDEGIDTGGGFVFPVTFPAISLPPKLRQSQLVVGGDAPAYPIIRFEATTASLVNPGFVTDDFRLDLNYAIPEGQYVEIDTRPWVMTVLQNGTASAAGAIAPRQRLDKMRLQPGRFEGRFVGSSSGVATCDVRWASTWNSY